MGSFGKSFDEAFKTSHATAQAGAFDVIKEKIKLDQTKAEEKYKATTTRNSNLAMITAIKDVDMAKKIAGIVDSVGDDYESQKNIGEMIAKQISPKEPINVYNVGQSGDLTSAGQVPAGSKVFKQALTPEEIGARTTASEFAKYGGVKEEAARAFSLRQELQAIPSVKEFQTIKNQVDSMEALVNSSRSNESKNSHLATDQGVITLFNKITDPTSVVRESEYERTPKNLSLANKFVGAFEKWKSGGAGLTQEDRESLLFGAKLMANSRGKGYNEILSNYENLSNKFGVEPELVTSGYGKFDGYDIGQSDIVTIKNNKLNL